MLPLSRMYANEEQDRLRVNQLPRVQLELIEQTNPFEIARNLVVPFPDDRRRTFPVVLEFPTMEALALATALHIRCGVCSPARVLCEELLNARGDIVNAATTEKFVYWGTGDKKPVGHIDCNAMSLEIEYVRGSCMPQSHFKAQSYITVQTCLTIELRK
ncbi:hypothetical protein Pelo_7971 [Pelomyxa schiedti]|nr:hypothetical protein Pelo_7971 [Pelomyxa schiedti]